MNTVSGIRSILVLSAYIFDIFCTLILLMALIWLLRTIPELHKTWMPVYYNGKNRKDYLACWEEMKPWEKAQARKQRVVSITGLSILILVHAGAAYLAFRFFFPAIISFAQNIWTPPFISYSPASRQGKFYQKLPAFKRGVYAIREQIIKRFDSRLKRARQ